VAERSFVREEIASQPECWRRAVSLAPTVAGLPARGERVAVVGCGTSWFIAQSYAALRESLGHGVTDAFAASEMPAGRDYDRVLAITRSGTTTEVLRLLERFPATKNTVLTGVPDAVGGRATYLVDLGFADEKSVVQTRFATTALAFLRSHLGVDMTETIAQAQAVLGAGPTELFGAEQFSFLGTGESVGIAHEAALKLREAACHWSESYPALEYRHGPISITGPNRVAWVFGELPDGLAEQIKRTGGMLVHNGIDPLADLVSAQLLAIGIAESKGMDPDNPRHLTRSVVLS
jgi:fructoselysine-6-P-deglycase FrlB-like protein